MLALLYFLLATQLYQATSIPSTYNGAAAKQSVTIHHANALPPTIETPKPTRKKKGPNIPLSISHQIYNLHVIPIQHQFHDLNHFINQNVHGNSTHTTHTTHTLIPVFYPIHNLVPVHDLTVIPLHRVDKISYGDDERDRYRTPLGGYGAGWAYGGHGAGHGFHYAYG